MTKSPPTVEPAKLAKLLKNVANATSGTNRHSAAVLTPQQINAGAGEPTGMIMRYRFPKVKAWDRRKFGVRSDGVNSGLNRSSDFPTASAERDDFCDSQADPGESPAD